MGTSILIALSLLTFGAFQKEELKLEIGSVLPARYVPKKNRGLYMTHSAQFRPFVKRKVGGIEYIIAYREESREIKYLSTYDKRFQTSGGLRVGNYVEVQGSQVEVYPGWEIRGPEGEDGWQPLIGFNSEMTIRIDGKDVALKLKPAQYQLDSAQPLRAKILAFVKGSN
jgi:hypothetical protein